MRSTKAANPAETLSFRHTAPHNHSLRIIVTPDDMLTELRSDNQQLVQIMRQVHNSCYSFNEVTTASLLEVWIDEAERRIWFLYETTRKRG
jgi:DNA-binding ferritin-like protein